MADQTQRLLTQHRDSQFLMQFPAQSVFDALAGLALAARKFPEPTLMDAFGAERDQHLPCVINDDSNSHMNDALSYFSRHVFPSGAGFSCDSWR
jgi:hypothetical protein